MRSADWKRISRPALTTTGASWSWAGPLAYIRPAGWVTHGVLAEDSRDRPGEFYLWVVQMPLTVPLAGVVDLSWSDRFGGGATVYVPGSAESIDAINRAGEAAIDNERRADVLVSPPGGADNVRMQEARAYGLLLQADERGALEVLRRVQRYDARYPWESEILDRASSVMALIESDHGADALALLQGWRTENCVSLGLACD